MNVVLPDGPSVWTVEIVVPMVRALAIDPKMPWAVYAGTMGGGVFVLRQ